MAQQNATHETAQVTMKCELPKPDYEGFVRWVEQSYCSDRYSSVHAVKDAKTGGKVVVRSGEHPAYSRFIKDIRPRLHEHGFVLFKSRENTYSGASDVEKPHEIVGIPILWVVMYANGNVCRRGACRHITAESYCDNCGPLFDKEPVEKPRMICP